MAAVAAEPLPTIVPEDPDDALAIDDPLGYFFGIDVIAHDAELEFSVVLRVLRTKRPGRAVAVRDDECRRDLDVGLGLVLALVAPALDVTDQELVVELEICHATAPLSERPGA